MTRIYRFLLLAVLGAAPIFACSCVNTADPCSDMSGSAVVFVGRVLVDSGEGMGKGPARVLVEEALWNAPKDVGEVEIDSSFGNSCHYRLKAGERYVIFAQRRDGQQQGLKIAACSKTFLLAGREHILEALRNQAQGGLPRLVGTVRLSNGRFSYEGGIAGVIVTARSEAAQYQAVTNSAGDYEIRGMNPDRYQLEVAKKGFVPDEELNRLWSGYNNEPGTISIRGSSCEVRDLSMWPHGRISGTVTSQAGGPLEGVTVQAFAIDTRGERESQPLQTGKTDSAGRYVIEPLPGGNYAVGVNAEKYSDRNAYPPTVFTRGESGGAGARIPISDGGTAANVDLVLPAKRINTVLRVEVRAPNGTPVRGAGVMLENLEGVQRWYSNQPTSDDGTMDVPGYLNERYVVTASAPHLRGSSRVDVITEHPSAVIVLAPEKR